MQFSIFSIFLPSVRNPIKKPGEDLALSMSYTTVNLLPVLNKLTEHFIYDWRTIILH